MLAAAAAAAGTKVTIPGFGVFEPRARAARLGRNPKTGEELQIAATVVRARVPGLLGCCLLILVMVTKLVAVGGSP